MDLGYRAEDILWLVEHGLLTLGYQSSSYLTDRVPELGVVDLPFLFGNTQAARAAMDGALGEVLARTVEERVNYRILGWFENGFRHISNRVRPPRLPADLSGLTIRVLPSKVQARTFELLGAAPMRMDLTEAIKLIAAGADRRTGEPAVEHRDLRRAQVSSFSHAEQSLLHLAADLPAPHRLRRLAGAPSARHAKRDHGRGRSSSVELHVQEEKDAREAIEAQGCEIVELTAGEHDAFRAAVQPLLDDARGSFGRDLFALTD